jgi:hypothetical protein
MADNTARIAQIRAILQGGVTQTAADGRSATWDLAALRIELQQLMREDDTQKVRKPRVSSVNIRNLAR